MLDKVILFVNLNKENAKKLSKEIVLCLKQRNVKADVFTFEGRPELKAAYDLAFSLGGDGTVLYTARAMAPLAVPIIPVNLGTLGFIAAVRPEKWQETFDLWLENKAPVSKRLMLKASVIRNENEVFSLNCLNDIVVSASTHAKMIRLQVFLHKTDSACTNAGLSNISLGQYRSDGLIFSTPTGSTAYSVSAGGPVLDPELEALIVNPICPFTLSYRPMVLPAKETLIVEVEEEQRSAVLITADGQETFALESGDRVFISPLSQRALLVSSCRCAFYDALRSKFSWLEGGGNTLGPLKKTNKND